jgi:hypothetical protein
MAQAEFFFLLCFPPLFISFPMGFPSYDPV